MQLLVGGLAFAVFIAFAAQGAGYSVTTWYPGALFLLALALVTLAARGSAGRSLSSPAFYGIAFLGAFTAWNFVSIEWSVDKGSAWDGSNRTLLYLIVFLVFLLLPWSGRSVAILLGGYSVAIAVLGLVTFARAAAATNPYDFFLISRFAQPAGYQNADCALFLMAVWPGLFLAARREVPLLIRGVALAAAGVLAELAVLSQSRASLVAAPLTLALFLLLVPNRVRMLPAIAAALAAVLTTSPVLLHVYRALNRGRAVTESLVDARNALLLTAAALFIVGAALATVDRGVALSPSATRSINRFALVVTVLAALAAIGVALHAVGNPTDEARRAWHQFRANSQPGLNRSYFSAGFGSNRYDIWRVAVREIERKPFAGVGSDNFAVDYYRERRSNEEPLYPHSLELRILAQTGIVGAALFFGFLVCAFSMVARAVAGAKGSDRGLVAVVSAAFAYWAIHGSVDWFWEIPGLGAPAFACLGLAGALGARTRLAPPTHVRRGLRTIFIGLGALSAAASLLFPWLAAKQVDKAAGAWRTSPREAFHALDHARALNPLSDEADLVAGAIAGRLHDPARMSGSFRRAVKRNPSEWYAYLEWGVADALSGRTRAALRRLERARELNPREPVIDLVEKGARRGRPVDPVTIARIFVRRVRTACSGSCGLRKPSP